MKSKKIRLISLLVLAISFVACTNDGTVMHKNITGAAGEMVVVISKNSWEGTPGKLIRETLAQPQLGLPQDEPIFNIIDVPQAAFKDIFRSTRNIIQTTISRSVETEGVFFKDDVWAYPQATVKIKAKDAGQFEKIFTENRIKIAAYFIRAEKERLTMNYNKFYEKEVFNVLNNKFNLTMKVPPGFAIAGQKEDLLWFKYETPEISQGILVYTFPYVSDSAFTVNYLLRIRDSLLRANVPGPTKGSYMTTEKRMEQTSNIREHNGNYASEMRGLWRVENDFMGGPYISLAELDVANQQVVVAFGYVYAPSKNKRNLLRQVEAMIYSLKMNDQAKNDKINSQVKMGN
ncbi:MAG: DUF4837 family protein [Prolixibacteraceae bacterium]|nr:DUF4837 family protein [Prolixibacteraceae bacterium]